MPVNARARSFPVTIRETGGRPSSAASIPTLMRSRLTLGCANKAFQQADLFISAAEAFGGHTHDNPSI